MKYFAGLDVSLKETAVCVVSEGGEIVREGKVGSDPVEIGAWLKRLGFGFEIIGLEAGPLSPWLHEGLRELGWPAVCIETRRMRRANWQAVKTDRNDARMIAQAMRMNWFSPVHVKSKASQELRVLLRNRKMLLEKRIAIDNELRGVLKGFGLKVGKVSAGRFAARVAELVADRPRLSMFVEPMLAARAALIEQYARLHRMVLAEARGHGVVRRLMTAPGVAAVVGLTFMSAIDDPQRFQRARDVGPHLGLTPRKYASGEIDRNGAISKCGDELAREALYQAAHTLLTRIKRWSPLKAWGLAVAKRRGLKRATVAVARKLSAILHRMWVDGTDFQWSKSELANPV